MGDFNDDGNLDLATLGESGVWLLTGKGGGVLKPAVLTPVNQSEAGTYKLVASDVNGDGNLDIVVTVQAGFAVLLGNGNGTFQPQIDTSVPFFLTAYAVGDLNGDGKPDLFAGSIQYGDGLLYLGNGDGTFTLTRQVNIARSRPADRCQP